MFIIKMTRTWLNSHMQWSGSSCSWGAFCPHSVYTLGFPPSIYSGLYMTHVLMSAQEDAARSWRRENTPMKNSSLRMQPPAAVPRPGNTDQLTAVALEPREGHLLVEAASSRWGQQTQRPRCRGRRRRHLQRVRLRQTLWPALLLRRRREHPGWGIRAQRGRRLKHRRQMRRPAAWPAAPERPPQSWPPAAPTPPQSGDPAAPPPPRRRRSLSGPLQKLQHRLAGRPRLVWRPCPPGKHGLSAL